MDSAGHNYDCIIDANILIDFLHANILKELKIRQGFRLSTTDLIADELTNPSVERLTMLGIIIINLPPLQIIRIYELSAIYKKLSIPDISALTVAESKELILLTGDGELRKAANEIGVEIRGTLWLLDNMIGHGIITRRAASVALELMVKKRRRLPKKEVNKRLHDWE